MDITKFLPNLPHQGLPTPRAWGQTWESLEEVDPMVAVPILLPPTVIGLVAGFLAGGGPAALPISLTTMGLGGAGGAAADRKSVV